MSNDLRAAVIKLAYANPSLRGELLPLLTKQAMEFPSEGALKKYLENHPGADRRNHSVAKPSAGGEKKEQGGGSEKVKVPEGMEDQMNELHRDYDETREAQKPIYHAVKNGNPVTKDMVKKLLSAVEEDLKYIEEYGYTSEGHKRGKATLDKIKAWAEKSLKGGEAPKADKNKGKGLRERKVPTPKFKGSEEQIKQAKSIIEKYGITDEELDDFADWKRAKPEPGDRTLDFATLKREWIESIKDPKKKEQARKRLAQMTPAEFKIMYLAVVADEEGEMGKMASSPSLRAAVIKLAHTNPSLRGHLLPLLIED